jgi:hypothetical protein
MADANQGTRMNFQVPEEMRTMAERSLTQTRQALDSFLGAARRTAETMEQTTEKVQAGAKLVFAGQGGRQAMSRRRLSTSAESFGTSR